MNSRTLAFILLTALLLGGLYWLFRPAPSVPPAARAPTSVSLPAPALPSPRRFDLVLHDGRLVSGPAVITVTQGEAVVLSITSDHADELHLHGYDLEAQLQPGLPATLAFTADQSGRFEIELHRAHRDLGALEVQPRP